jgi:Glucose-6-phosphate dehydrogenase, C-terminal domain
MGPTDVPLCQHLPRADRNRRNVANVQITMAEAFGVQGRGTFYDSVGAVRDLWQNHLLQVVALLAMEPLVDAHPDSLWHHHLPDPATTDTKWVGRVGAAHHTGRAQECGCAQEAPLVSSRWGQPSSLAPSTAAWMVNRCAGSVGSWPVRVAILSSR